MARVVICVGILDVKRLLKLAEFIIRERASIQCLFAPQVSLSYSDPHGILLIILQHSAFSANIAERDGDILSVNFWSLTDCCNVTSWRFGLDALYGPVILRAPPPSVHRMVL